MKETYHHLTHLTGSLLAVVFATFTLLACHEEQQLLTVPESATLKLTLGAPHMSVATRGISDDPDMKGTWTDDEKLKDGRILKELALLLLDGNTLVGTQNFSYADNATVTQDATFKGLVAGKSYRLIAIANYSGLSNFPVITGLSVNTDISTTLNSLYAYTLDAGGDFVVTPQKQPLTLVQDITMPASGGTYEVSGELVRTFARLRIEVANKSDIHDLTINGLSFNTPFAQQNAYLLTRPEDIDRNFAGFTKGKPIVTSTDALTQYVAGTTVSKGNNSKVLFDSYILESRNGDGGYRYTLDVEYKGASFTTTTTKITLRTIDAVSGVASDATQISRNDFINVLVNVAYNENTGTMEFYVKDWGKVQVVVPSFE